MMMMMPPQKLPSRVVLLWAPLHTFWCFGSSAKLTHTHTLALWQNAEAARQAIALVNASVPTMKFPSAAALALLFSLSSAEYSTRIFFLWPLARLVAHA